MFFIRAILIRVLVFSFSLLLSIQSFAGSCKFFAATFPEEGSNYQLYFMFGNTCFLPRFSTVTPRRLNYTSKGAFECRDIGNRPGELFVSKSTNEVIDGVYLTFIEIGEADFSILGNEDTGTCFYHRTDESHNFDYNNSKEDFFRRIYFSRPSEAPVINGCYELRATNFKETKAFDPRCEISRDDV